MLTKKITTSLFGAAILVGLVNLAPQIARAQICAGSTLNYVVRDAKGSTIERERPSDLTFEGEAGTSADGKWNTGDIAAGALPPDFKKVKGKAWTLNTRGMCTFFADMKLRLTWKGRTMNLLFRRPKVGQYDSRRYVVDSLPFQAGSFEIDLTPVDGKYYFPPSSWKKAGSESKAQ